MEFDHVLSETNNPARSYKEWGGLDAPEQHSLMLLPQSLFDGWSGHCSCGKWQAMANFYHFPNKEILLTAISDAHKKHLDGATK